MASAEFQQTDPKLLPALQGCPAFNLVGYKCSPVQLFNYLKKQFRNTKAALQDVVYQVFPSVKYIMCCNILFGVNSKLNVESSNVNDMMKHVDMLVELYRIAILLLVLFMTYKPTKIPPQPQTGQEMSEEALIFIKQEANKLTDILRKINYVDILQYCGDQYKKALKWHLALGLVPIKILDEESRKSIRPGPNEHIMKWIKYSHLCTEVYDYTEATPNILITMSQGQYHIVDFRSSTQASFYKFTPDYMLDFYESESFMASLLVDEIILHHTQTIHQKNLVANLEKPTIVVSSNHSTPTIQKSDTMDCQSTRWREHETKLKKILSKEDMAEYERGGHSATEILKACREHSALSALKLSKAKDLVNKAATFKNINNETTLKNLTQSIEGGNAAEIKDKVMEILNQSEEENIRNMSVNIYETAPDDHIITNSITPTLPSSLAAGEHSATNNMQSSLCAQLQICKKQIRDGNKARVEIMKNLQTIYNKFIDSQSNLHELELENDKIVSDCKFYDEQMKALVKLTSELEEDLQRVEKDKKQLYEIITTLINQTNINEQERQTILQELAGNVNTLFDKNDQPSNTKILSFASMLMYHITSKKSEQITTHLEVIKQLNITPVPIFKDVRSQPELIYYNKCLPLVEYGDSFTLHFHTVASKYNLQNKCQVDISVTHTDDLRIIDINPPPSPSTFTPLISGSGGGGISNSNVDGGGKKIVNMQFQAGLNNLEQMDEFVKGRWQCKIKKEFHLTEGQITITGQKTLPLIGSEAKGQFIFNYLKSKLSSDKPTVYFNDIQKLCNIGESKHLNDEEAHRPLTSYKIQIEQFLHNTISKPGYFS